MEEGLIFFGDSYFDESRPVPDIISIGEFLRRESLHAIINLEGPLRGDKPLLKGINLTQSERLGRTLKELNVRAANLANNHIMDWGTGGLRRTLDYLSSQDILTFGAGLTLAEAQQPRILRLGKATIGMLGFGWDVEMCVKAGQNKAGVAPLHLPSMLKAISSLKACVDRVVVQCHWGYEYDPLPLPLHRKIAAQCAEAGADLIVGHHPHVVQAMERIKEVPVYYSVGNFYFGTMSDRFGPGGNRGLGIIYRPGSREVSVIGIVRENRQTSICTRDNDVADISNIGHKAYLTMYKRARVSRRPCIVEGRPLRNHVKLAALRAWIYVINNAVGLLKRWGVHEYVRRGRIYSRI